MVSSAAFSASLPEWPALPAELKRDAQLMKKYAIIGGLIVLGLTLFVGSLLLAGAQRPAMPEKWWSLNAGMTPEQVRSVVSDDIYDLRAARGIDVVVHTGKYGHWQMILRYNSAGHAVSATARYIHTFGFGLLNTGGKKVF